MIDWKRVVELKAEIGSSEFDEVVELFLEEVDAQIAKLQANPNPATYEEDLHFIKGCAMNLGFKSLAGLCLKGETTSAAGRAVEVALEPIFQCYNESKAVFFLGVQDGLAA